MEGNPEILLLDDEEIVCKRLKPALEKEGYRVETYTKSTEAKKRLEEKRFDIVITDLKMSDIDGMELFQYIKDNWPGTQVIIISAFATIEVTRMALQAGVRDVISKPFKISHLKEIINSIAAEMKRGVE